MVYHSGSIWAALSLVGEVFFSFFWRCMKAFGIDGDESDGKGKSGPLLFFISCFSLLRFLF